MLVVSAMLVAVLWQIVCADGVGITSGVGFTVTSKLNGVPGHNVGAGPVGVMMYLTTPGDVPVLSSVWLIRVPQEDEQSLNPLMVPPVGDVSTDAVQVNVVPVVRDWIV